MEREGERSRRECKGVVDRVGERRKKVWKAVVEKGWREWDPDENVEGSSGQRW